MANLANECVNIRAILEKRLFESVMELGEEATARQKTALRNARLGRLSSMRIFHLVDNEDKGSREQPMAQLSKLKSKIEQTSLVTKSFRMLERILSVAFPEQQAQLVKFIGSFSAKIEMFINDNMPMETLNFFVMNVFKKMCTPAERYRVAERSTPYIAVNDEWIGVQRSFMDKVNAGHMIGLAGGKRVGEPPSSEPKAQRTQPGESNLLANSTDVEPPSDAHSTSMGTHNLNMIGNMPVAQEDEPAEARWPRPADWEESDDDVEDEVCIDLRCARCLHRYYPGDRANAPRRSCSASRTTAASRCHGPTRRPSARLRGRTAARAAAPTTPKAHACSTRSMRSTLLTTSCRRWRRERRRRRRGRARHRPNRLDEHDGPYEA